MILIALSFSEQVVIVHRLCLSRLWSLTGAELFGNLAGDSSEGPVCDAVDVPDMSWSGRQCRMSNDELIASLREDVHSDALHSVTLEDARLGWMSQPTQLDAVDLSTARPSVPSPIWRVSCLFSFRCD